MKLWLKSSSYQNITFESSLTFLGKNRRRDYVSNHSSSASKKPAIIIFKKGNLFSSSFFSNHSDMITPTLMMLATSVFALLRKLMQYKFVLFLGGGGALALGFAIIWPFLFGNKIN